MYEQSYVRKVPEWVPESFRGTVSGWLQRKWPAEDWRHVEGHHHHYVAWGVYGLVIGICLTAPYWLKRNHEEPPPAPEVEGTPPPPASS